ncbi:pilin [Allohahella marinimesophila]|uniref:Pilin n=1 Tax=Allohahella marinimesophila TaxID=1054972 RepID=A0ABP7NYU7_9GAMM
MYISMSRGFPLFAAVLVIGACTVTSEQPTAEAEMIEGFLAGSAVRYAVQDYAIEHGSLPASNADLGLPEPEAYARGALAAVAVGDRGRITLTFNDRSGVDGGTIQLVPIASDALYGMQWDCRTASYEGIQSWAPACRYAPAEQ